MSFQAISAGFRYSALPVTRYSSTSPTRFDIISYALALAV